MRSILRFNRPYSTRLAGAIALSAASLLTAMGLLATSAWLISEASTRPPILALEVAIVAVRTFGLSRGLLKYVSRLVEHDVALKTQTDLRSRIYENFRLSSSLQIAQMRKGQMMQQLVADVDTTQDLWLRLWNPWISALLNGVAGVGIIYALLPAFGVALGAIFASTMAAIPLIAWFSRSSADIRSQESGLFDQVLQSFSSVEESLIFGYQGALLSSVQKRQEEISVLDRRAARWAGVASAAHAKALGISLVLGALYTSTAYAHGLISGVNVAVVILLPLAIFDGVSSLPLAFSRAMRVRDAMNAIEPLLEKKDESGPEPIRSSKTLVVDELTPLIPGKMLPTFSGKASPGKPWIISGPSGYGKSSFLFALLGFIAYSGEIRLDNLVVNNLSTFTTTTLLQDDHLFATSIRENLKIGKPDATDVEILDMLSLVELDHLINDLPEGINTIVGESGFNFSGGEKQRLKLARVLLRDTDLYLLDEPFEYLSMSQATRFKTKIFQRLEGKTLVVVSHLPIS